MVFNKTLLRFFILIGIFTTLPACSDYPRAYSAEAIQAKVIDAKTKNPLEGVIITANWQLESGNVGGVTYVGQMMVMETVTDKDGKFYFPAWGPKPLKKGLLLNHDPQLLLFKPGYRYLALYNTFEDKMYLKPVRHSEWNGKTIEMKRFEGNLEQYASNIYNLDRDLEFARYGLMGTLEDCEWKKVPQMLVALDRMSQYFDSKGVKLPGWRGGARIRKVTDVGNQGQCGSANDFFRSYLP